MENYNKGPYKKGGYNKGPYNKEDYPLRQPYHKEEYQGGNYHNDDRVINGENLNIDTTLEEIANEIKPGETLIIDIGNNYFHQTDEIFDVLILKGYDVRKSYRNGRNQLIVRKNILH